MNKTAVDKKQRHGKKLGNLILEQKKPNTIQNFSPKFVNISDISLTEQEIELLNKGLKYCPPPNVESKLLDIAIETNSKINDPRVLHSISLELDGALTGDRRHEKAPKELKQLTHKIRDSGVIVTKADKSNALVLFNETDYRQKIQVFLDQDIINKCRKDPTTEIQKDLKEVLRTSGQLTPNPQTLIQMNPRPPRLQGYIKTHKVSQECSIKEVPIRPVVSTCQSVTYDLEKFLLDKFKKHVNWRPKYTIRNSVELAEKLKNINLPNNAKLVSLDVDNLFTNVDVPRTINRVRNILKPLKIFSRGN